MIRDLSETLEQLVTTELPGVQVELVRPSDPYNPAQGLTTLNLFLFDIRENVDLRSNERVITRVNNQATITPPPLRVSCSYLVTAWPDGNIDLELREHRLLSQALQVFSRFPTIPPAFLQGGLVGQEPPLPMMAASTNGPPNPAEFWTALANRLRASFVLSVTIGMPLFDPIVAPQVLTAETGQSLAADGPGGLEAVPGTREASFRIAGAVTDNAAVPVADATVTALPTGVQAKTAEDGRYDLGVLPTGAYTLRVQSGAITQDFNVNVPAPLGADYDLQLV
jgi:hypothetical protein